MNKKTTSPHTSGTDRQLDFVIRHYQEGKFNTQQALRRIVPARPVPLWRKWAAAASVTLLLAGGTYAAYLALADATPATPGTTAPQQPPTRPTAAHHFHFDHTPLPQVLSQLGRHYGVRLTATTTDKQPATDKQLTADFDAASLDETLPMIERVLNVRITVE